LLRIGTVCSGGLAAPEQALKQLNITHKNIFACDFDKFARENYLANHKIKIKHFHIDINDMDGKQYANKVDIVAGGTPCQDFSIAGLRAGTDGHRGQLIWQYFRIVKETKPKIFIYENVKGMVSDNNGRTLKDFLETFRSIGYHCHSQVLNTKDYGVPQNRERIYIVGFLNHSEYVKFSFAQKQPLLTRLKDVLEHKVDEKYYINRELDTSYKSQSNTIHDERKPMPTICAGAHGYASGYVKVIGMIDSKGHDIIRRVHDKDGICPTLTMTGGGNQEPKIQVKSAIKKGYETATIGDSINLSVPNSKTRRGRVGKQVAQTLDTSCNQAVVEPKIIDDTNDFNEIKKREYTEYSPALRAGRSGLKVQEPRIIASRGRNPKNSNSREAGLPTKQMLEVNENGTSNTLTTVQKDNYVLEENYRIRKLTPRECFRLQGCDDSFKIAVSNSQAYKIAGNAMSVNILEMIFTQILNPIKQNNLFDFLEETEEEVI